MLKFVYGVWHFVATPKVYLHDDGYFIYRFESEQDKASIMENGPYTYNNRPLILKTWTPEFQMSKEPIRLIPLWLCFPRLPLLYWTEENLGRIASYLGKPICTDRLAAQEDRVFLTNRLKKAVNYLVSKSQSTFIEGRSILDNVIVAHELVKGYSRKGVSPRCIIKVDIRKAYDSVEWRFLKMILLEFGIPFRIVNLIMTCVTTVSYTLLINRGLTSRFQAKKGLRQGDPMSPYLFVLAMEYLNRSLKQLRHNPNFNFHPKCANRELIHICFADDLLMCCRADKISIQLMLQAFQHFSEVEGLQANLDKSSIYLAGVSQEFKA